MGIALNSRLRLMCYFDDQSSDDFVAVKPVRRQLSRARRWGGCDGRRAPHQLRSPRMDRIGVGVMNRPHWYRKHPKYCTCDNCMPSRVRERDLHWRSRKPLSSSQARIVEEHSKARKAREEAEGRDASE